jgi:hypothetical protein
MRFSFNSFCCLLAVAFFSIAGAAQFAPRVTLRSFLEARLKTLSSPKEKEIRFNDLCPVDNDPIALRVFAEYGAMFVGEETRFPPRCIFAEPSEVEQFHDQLKTKEIVVNGTVVQLQKPAADALISAVEEAALVGARITPLDGAIAGKRNFADTLKIWNSRFLPALDHWVAKGKIDRSTAATAVVMPLRDQISKVMEWESKGYYFSTGFSKSIFNSVAPPGTSQHLSLIAFDVVEASDPRVRSILNKHGWYQTIKTDEPHFTYLGIDEAELPSRGLKRFVRGGHTFWIPNL